MPLPAVSSGVRLPWARARLWLFEYRDWKSEVKFSGLHFSELYDQLSRTAPSHQERQKLLGCGICACILSFVAKEEFTRYNPSGSEVGLILLWVEGSQRKITLTNNLDLVLTKLIPLRFLYKNLLPFLLAGRDAHSHQYLGHFFLSRFSPWVNSEVNDCTESGHLFQLPHVFSED